MEKPSYTITIISTIATLGILLVMTATLVSQKGFNESQIEFNQRIADLSEVAAMPQVFVVFDSLTDQLSPGHNIHYSIKNVGNTPALAVRSASIVTPATVNPFDRDLDTTGVHGDLFPNQSKVVASFRPFRSSRGDTLYLHVRVDYEDMLNSRYCYLATYYIMVLSATPPEPLRYRSGMEASGFFPLDKSKQPSLQTSSGSAQSYSGYRNIQTRGEAMAFAGTFIGAFIGVLGAFWVQSVLMQKGVKLRKRDQLERKKYILEILKGEIDHNVQLLNQIQKEYQNTKWIGYYGLDTTSKESVWHELIKMEEDRKFIYNLSRTYYEYQHMNRKLDLQLNSAPHAWQAFVGAIRSKVVSSITAHTDSLLSGSKDRLREIDEKLKSLP